MDVEGTAAGPGLLALSASAVAGGYLYLRRRYTIDPGGAAAAAAGAQRAAWVPAALRA